ncbi:MAG TPA: hypothetical protein VJ846_11990 [Sphingomicrobium sp.]|nr:hypothetical protein [Sphingomicrobium sp.]
MNKLSVFLGLSLAALASDPALTQTSAVTQRYLACVAEQQPGDVRILLSTSNADVARHAYEHLANSNRCFNESVGNHQFTPDELGFSIGLLRGSLAEHALIAEAPKVERLQALPLQQKRYIRPWFAATGRNPAVDEMGACMADTDSAGIMYLLRTQPGSSQEMSAIGALTPALTKCLSAGMRLDADPRGLRAALADALYQRLENPGLSMPNVPERQH